LSSVAWRQSCAATSSATANIVLRREGTHARVMHHRREIIEPTIAEHHGRTVKWTGDGFLAMFDSPLEAVRCAIVIQQSVSVRNTALIPANRIEYRMAVNPGRHLRGRWQRRGAPSDQRGPRDGEHLRGRLRADQEQASQPISSLGDEKLKNITDPVRIYRVLPDPAAVKTYSRRNFWLSSTTAAALFLLLVGGITCVVMREQSRIEAAALGSRVHPAGSGTRSGPGARSQPRRRRQRRSPTSRPRRWRRSPTRCRPSRHRCRRKTANAKAARRWSTFRVGLSRWAAMTIPARSRCGRSGSGSSRCRAIRSPSKNGGSVTRRTSAPSDVRVTNRAYYDVGVRYPAHGFRVVRPMKTGG
jgi:hypothetical protein